LPTFSGQELKSKDAFEAWLFALESLMTEGHPLQGICAAVRKSLKGPAMQWFVSFQREKESFTAEELKQHMTDLFGLVTPASMVYQQFFSMQQGCKEDVLAWGLNSRRLCTIC